MKNAITDNVSLYIIVADEEIKDHELVKKAVKECDLNYIVSSVYSGSQLLDLLLKRGIFKDDRLRDPDIIILDLNLHDLNGIELLHQIKRIEHLKHIPIHVLSKNNSIDERHRAMTAGACGFHAKPLVYAELLHLIKNICNSVAA